MGLTYDQLSAITEKKFIPKLIDNIYNTNALFKKLSAKGETMDGGTSIVQPLEYAISTSGGWVNDNETLTLVDTDVYTAAQFEWKQIYEPIIITRRDELKNSGDAAKVNFVKSKTQSAQKAIRDNMGTGLHNAGTNAKAILGLRSFLSTSATYGGISQTTYSWWAAQVDSTTTTLSVSAMQTMYGTCSIGDSQPDLILGTQTNYNRYYSCLQPSQRFMSEEMAKGGFTSLKFNGADFVVDSHCYTGYLYFLTTEFLHLYAHPQENFRFEPFAKPIDKNSQVAKIFWMGAFVCGNCSKQGLFSALTA
jgi:hypothetical protein